MLTEVWSVVCVEIAATVIYFEAVLKKKKSQQQTAENMYCYHGFIQPETTLQQALLDLRLFIQTEYFCSSVISRVIGSTN